MNDVVTANVSLKTKKVKLLDFSSLEAFINEKVGMEDVFSKIIVLRDSTTTLNDIFYKRFNGGNALVKSGTAIDINFSKFVELLTTIYLPQEKRSPRSEVKLKKIIAVLNRVAKKFVSDGTILVYFN